jgi:galactokinase
MGRETIADRILREFSNRFAGSPRLYRSPGRINIIGEHTDYNGGHVLPATLDLYTWAAMAPEDDPVLCIYLSDQDKTLSIPCGTAPMQKTGTEEDYFRGVLWALQQEGIEIAGCNIVIAGNLPIGAGLSSSASLEILLASMLLDRTGLVLPLQKIAMICHRAETQFVGVQCGIMDQYAIALGDPGTAMLIDCKSARYEKVPSPEDCCFFLVDSGVRRKLASGFFNERRKQCSRHLFACRTTIRNSRACASWRLMN